MEFYKHPPEKKLGDNNNNETNHPTNIAQSACGNGA
jgi:hypothetical protein